MPNNVNLDEIKELSSVCSELYNDKVINDVVLGWNVSDVKNVKTCGFYAALLEKEGRFLIVYRGTNDILDWIANGLIGFTVRSKQFRLAEEFYTSSIAKCADKEHLTLAGHSLGGGLAEYIGAKNTIRTFTFNGIGIKHYLKAQDIEGKDFSFITNFISVVDLVGNLLPHTNPESFYVKQPQFIINNSNELLKIKNKIITLKKIATSITGVTSYISYKTQNIYNKVKNFVYEKTASLILQGLELVNLGKTLTTLMQREVVLANVYEDMANKMLAEKSDAEWFKVAHGLEYFTDVNPDDILYLKDNHFLA